MDWLASNRVRKSKNFQQNLFHSQSRRGTKLKENTFSRALKDEKFINFLSFKRNSYIPLPRKIPRENEENISPVHDPRERRKYLRSLILIQAKGKYRKG